MSNSSQICVKFVSNSCIHVFVSNSCQICQIHVFVSKSCQIHGKLMQNLCQIRDKFFCDPDKVESAVPFQDIHSKVPSVFSDLDRVLSPTNGVVVSGVLDKLKKELVELREDPVFRDDLDQLYKVFLKEMAQTAKRKVQNCILSIM